MEILILAIVVIIGSGLGLGLLYHLGWENRLETLAEVFSAGAHVVTQRVARAYFETFLPAMRRTKWFTIGVVAAMAVMAWVIDLHWFASLVVTLVAAGICTAVALLEREGRVENGHGDVLPNTDVQPVVYVGGAFDRLPLIDVTMYDRGEFSVEHVHPQGFSVRLDAPVPAADPPAHFSWRAAERPQGNPALSIVSTAFSAFALIGVTLFVAGIACQSRQAVLLSVAPSALAIATFFTLARFGVWVAEKTASVAEFLPNWGIQFAAMAAKRDFSKIDEVLQKINDSKSQVVNAVDQEEFKKTWKHNLLKVIAAASSVYGLAILVPTWWCFVAWTTCQIIAWLWIHQYEYRINQLKLEQDQALKEIDEAKKRSAPASVVTEIEGRAGSFAKTATLLTGRLWRMRVTGLTFYIGMTAAILVLVLYTMLVPGALARVDTLVADASAMIHGLFDGSHQGFGWIFGKALGSYIPALFAMVIAALAAGAIRGTGESKLRNIAAWPFAILALAAFLAFSAGALTATAATVRDETVGTGKLIEVDGLTADITPQGKPELSWSSMTGTKGFTVQRRQVTDAAFADASAVLANGVNTWRDDSATTGETYYYRLVTKTGTEDIVSNEVKVTVVVPPKPKAPHKAPPVKTGETPRPPTASTPCTSDACGQNLALAELCARYPDSCK